MLQLKLSMEQDRQNIHSENQSLEHLQTEYMQIREENLRLSSMIEHLNKEYNDLLHGRERVNRREIYNYKIQRQYCISTSPSEHKRVKSDHGQLKIKHGDLDRTFSECREQLSNMDVEVSRISSKCEVR